MSQQTALFDAEPVASVRRDDLRSSKEAAAAGQVERADQWKRLLQRLHLGPISADTAGLVIDRHRHIASARLGVMQRRGLVEPAGFAMERSVEGGSARKVIRYRLTPAGRVEWSRMFGRVE